MSTEKKALVITNAQKGAVIIKIPALIFSEISGWKKQRIAKVYGEHLSNGRLPLSILPIDFQEKYINDYIFHERILDIDLLRLTEGEDLLHSPGVQAFFKDTRMLRDAQLHNKDLASIAKDNGITLRTLERRKKIFMSDPNLKKILENEPESYLYNDNRPTICILGKDYVAFRVYFGGNPIDNKILREMQENLKDFKCSDCPYSKEWQKSHNEEIPFTCHRNTTTMVIPAQRKTVNAVHNELPQSDCEMARLGVHYWESKHNFTPTRKKPQKVNSVWFSDHVKLDIFVIVGKNSDGSNIIKRVWLTGILDAATNALVGYCLTTRPGSDSIAEAFAHACVYTVGSEFVGIPRYFYCDNGRDYRSARIEGSSEATGTTGNDGMFRWLGVKVIHALPYHGSSKTIERTWRTLQENWISDLPGYTGNSPNKRSQKLSDEIKKGRLYTFQQFSEIFNDNIWPEYNAFKSSPDKKSPIELYREKEKEDTLIPTWRTMAVLKHKSTERILQQSGIKYENHWYWHPKLAKIEPSTPLRIFAFDSPFNRSIAVTLGNRFIAEAHPVKEMSVIEAERYRIMQHVAEQRRSRREVNKRLKELRKIIRLSELEELGVKVPAIEEVSYVQAVDEKRDKTAVDAPGVPKELHTALQRYQDEKAEKNEKKKDLSMDLFFRKIGKDILKDSENWKG